MQNIFAGAAGAAVASSLASEHADAKDESNVTQINNDLADLNIALHSSEQLQMSDDNLVIKKPL